jgi:hypothetical protein
MRDSQNENNIETSLKIDRDLPIAARLLSSSSTVQIGDVAFYLDQKDRIQSISAIIAASELLKSRPADCGIIASKFVGTTVLDATIFMGMPVSSSLVAAYELGVRWLQRKVSDLFCIDDALVCVAQMRPRVRFQCCLQP